MPTHWRRQAEQLEAALIAERAGHARSQEERQQESIKRHTAEQQIVDLKERLSENDAHRNSLEEKHVHARQALDHYRQSVKEQRDQDQRRHEQQLQQLQAELRAASQAVVIKQEEVTRLNQEGARLVADLSHAHRALNEEQARNRRLEAKIELLHSREQRLAALEGQCADRVAALEDTMAQLAAANASIESLHSELLAAQLELIGARSAQETQQALFSELKAFLIAGKQARPQTEE